MISNKLVKEARKSDIIVEFSLKEELPEVVSQFLKICKGEALSVKRSNFASYQISFYYVTSKKTTTLDDMQMKDIPTELEHAMTIIYMNHQIQSKIDLPEKPGVRTLLLREDLQPKYSLEYETENIQSKKGSLSFLCDLAAAFINRAYNKEVEFFDQKVEEVIKVKRNEANVLKDIWVNILYQVPGLGKDKCLKIVQNFPTYQSILQDYEGKQRLKDIMVGKTKLGMTLAKRIYRVFVGTKYKESVIE